ncbi:SAVED domain-containing protein, partial [Alicyclobacillus acidiphilus]
FFFIYIKRKIYILNINGYYDRRIEGHNDDVNLGTFDFKEREIDFIRIFKHGIDNSSAHEIREIVEEKVTSFKKESEHFKRGYTGTAPIPFVVLAGSFMARETIHEYFEFDKKETQRFYRLSQKGRYGPLKVVTDVNSIDKDAEDVVIAVSVTAKITDADLAQFQGQNIIKLAIDDPRDNAIRYRSQLIEYKNAIISIVESVGKEMPNLKRIHLVCSCQSCLALELGKEIDDRRVHQVICYFFDIQKSPRYPWGIVVNGDQKGTFIQA